jgi:hypothetical protein
VSALLRRLLRLWGQSRIRLPRRPPGPGEIGPGDRLQIGSRVWRVGGRLLLASGGWMFRLEALGDVPGEREGRLVAPAGGPAGAWRLLHDGAEHLLPPGCVLVFPASQDSPFDKPGGESLRFAASGPV